MQTDFLRAETEGAKYEAGTKQTDAGHKSQTRARHAVQFVTLAEATTR